MLKDSRKLSLNSFRSRTFGETLTPKECLTEIFHLVPCLLYTSETMWKAYGYNEEVIRTVILSMSEKGEEPVISMGFDSPLAVLSNKSQ